MAEYSWANRASERQRESKREREKNREILKKRCRYFGAIKHHWHIFHSSYFFLLNVPLFAFFFPPSTKQFFLLRAGGGLVGGETERLPWKQSTSPIWASLMAHWRGNNCVPLASLWEREMFVCVLWYEEQQRMCCVIQYSMNKGFRENQTVRVSAQTHGESCSLVIGPSVGSRAEGNLNIIERLSIL